MDKQAWFLGTEVVGGPELAFFWQEQRADHRADDFMAGGNLLQIGVGHGQTSGDGAPII